MAFELKQTYLDRNDLVGKLTPKHLIKYIVMKITLIRNILSIWDPGLVVNREAEAWWTAEVSCDRRATASLRITRTCQNKLDVV